MGGVNASALYSATFTKEEVFSAATVTLINNQYVPIGEYTVKADELVGIGRGALVAQNEAIGRMFAKFFDSTAIPVQVTAGKFRIMLLSSQDMPIGGKPVYIDVDLMALTTGETIPQDRFVLPFDNTMLSQDKKIQFLIKNTSGSNITLSKANSTVLLDMTRALL